MAIWTGLEERAPLVITETDRISLRWMIRCNSDHIGFLGPSVRKFGPLPELAALVSYGLAELRAPLVKRSERGGYWITEAGRTALATSGVIPTPAETGGDVSQEPKPDRMERSEPSPFPNPTANSGES